VLQRLRESEIDEPMSRVSLRHCATGGSYLFSKHRIAVHCPLTMLGFTAGVRRSTRGRGILTTGAAIMVERRPRLLGIPLTKSGRPMVSKAAQIPGAVITYQAFWDRRIVPISYFSALPLND
jgi:hypothetical protein